VPDPNVTYAPYASVTPETELSALVNVYRFLLKCQTNKEGSRPGIPDTEKGSKLDRASARYTR
jgi:hypothetical protein